MSPELVVRRGCLNLLSRGTPLGGFLPGHWAVVQGESHLPEDALVSELEFWPCPITGRAV